jgi:endonuclease/exonuclease/phosphatase family metal-dependent hydrolase
LPPLALPTPRSYGLLELDDAGGPLRIINTHYSPSFGPAARLEHTAALLDVLGRRGLARTVVVGDLNAHPTEPAVRVLLDAGLADAAAEAGPDPGFTAPSWRPVVRIDYILHSADLIASEVTVGGGGASDHLWVRATLRPR